MTKRKLTIMLIGLLLYLLSSFTSYMALSKTILKNESVSVSSIAGQPKQEPNGSVTFSDTLPKTEPCPLNGQLYSKQQRNWWEQHRPLGVMIENHEDARPQSGLTSADVVYEAVAEGGITRFLAVFYCQDAKVIGPVRSARTYFLDFISEYGDYPLYAHVGGANTPGPANALGQIEKYGWEGYNDLNQFSVGFPVYWRDYERLGHPVATEHTMYSSASKLWAVGKERGLTNVDKNGQRWNNAFTQYQFKEDAPVSDRPADETVQFNFWDGYPAYAVQWQYDRKTNEYLRSNGGQKHIDKNNNKQLFAKNVVMIFMSEANANDGYEDNLHLLYGTKGTGKAVIFMDGKEMKGTWSKYDRTARTVIRDNTGSQIQFNRGLLWFEIVPIGDSVSVH